MRIATLLIAALLLGCQSPTSEITPQPKPQAQPAQAQPAPSQVTPTPPSGPIIDHTVKLLDGSDKSLADYRGKAVLIVNTASECGYTPQYADLQKLYADYADKGLVVLAFPSNDFGAQEPGTPEQIREFVDSKYQVEFEMFDKVVTTGPDKAPLYKTLTEETGPGIAGDIKWNFTKFLVDPNGRVVARFEPPVKPTDEQLISAIEHVLPPGA